MTIFECIKISHVSRFSNIFLTMTLGYDLNFHALCSCSSAPFKGIIVCYEVRKTTEVWMYEDRNNNNNNNNNNNKLYSGGNKMLT